MKISTTQKIVPFLWYDNKAEEAALQYTSIFPDSRILTTTRQPSENNKGPVQSIHFTLQNQLFYGFNGGPHFQFTPAISLFVHCADQQEIDYYWDKLLVGGRPDRCGWLRDAYGVSWQIIPNQLGAALQQKDRDKAQRAMQAMLKMEKIIIKDLENAWA